MFISLISDDTALPSTDLNDLQSETPSINISSIVTGTNTFTIPRTVLAAGTYHVVVRTDAEYDGIFSTGVTSIEVDTRAAGSGASTFSDPTWSGAGVGMIFDLKGYELDFRIRITSSASDKKLRGYGVFYDEAPGVLVPGVKKIQIESFDGIVDNENEFTLTFLADPDLLKVYERGTGQVYTIGDFSLNGNIVSFPVDTFKKTGTVVLKFEEVQGSSFDNADANALLMAASHLGSLDGSIDKSIAGFGVLLRADNGTLVEAAIEEDTIPGTYKWVFHEVT
jgi:hypothetical protein